VFVLTTSGVVAATSPRCSTRFEVRGADLDLQRISEYALKLDAATAERLGSLALIMFNHYDS
jgi:hypothetical protein